VVSHSFFIKVIEISDLIFKKWTYNCKQKFPNTSSLAMISHPLELLAIESHYFSLS
jgi:hypothetical protein